MPTSTTLRLPDYNEFIHSITELNLPISASELHGMMCGYLCAGDASKGEAYLRTLFNNQNGLEKRPALLVLFSAFAISQQQMDHFDFEFQLLLPDENEALLIRAQAFSEWCEGFTQGISMAGVDYDQLEDDEMKEAIEHLKQFARLDYGSLDVEEEDERALMEVSEYARMAVLRIYNDLHADRKLQEQGTAH